MAWMLSISTATTVAGSSGTCHPKIPDGLGLPTGCSLYNVRNPKSIVLTRTLSPLPPAAPRQQWYGSIRTKYSILATPLGATMNTRPTIPPACHLRWPQPLWALRSDIPSTPNPPRRTPIVPSPHPPPSPSKSFHLSGRLFGPIESPRASRTDAGVASPAPGRRHNKIARTKAPKPPLGGNLSTTPRRRLHLHLLRPPLFASSSKSIPAPGWPSFFQPTAKENVIRPHRHTLGMSRTRNPLARCDCHLGHVFNDATPTGSASA